MNISSPTLLTDIAVVEVPAIAEANKGRGFDVNNIGELVPGIRVADQVSFGGWVPRSKLGEEAATNR